RACRSGEELSGEWNLRARPPPTGISREPGCPPRGAHSRGGAKLRSDLDSGHGCRHGCARPFRGGKSLGKGREPWQAFHLAECPSPAFTKVINHSLFADVY